MLDRLKTHLLSAHTKNYAPHPTFFNIFASFFCAALLLAWGGVCWHLGWQSWQTGNAIVKTMKVTAENSLIFCTVIAGVFSLGTFSFNTAVQYAIEGALRVRNRRGSA